MRFASSFLFLLPISSFLSSHPTLLNFYSIILVRTALYCTALHCTALYCTVLYRECILRTSLGDIHIKLFPSECPRTVENFSVRNIPFRSILFCSILIYSVQFCSSLFVINLFPYLPMNLNEIIIFMIIDFLLAFFSDLHQSP